MTGQRQHTVWPALALTLNAFVWGTSWWPFRRLESHGLHPLWATALIYLLAVALIVAMRPRAFGQLLRRARPHDDDRRRRERVDEGRRP